MTDSPKCETCRHLSVENMVMGCGFKKTPENCGELFIDKNQIKEHSLKVQQAVKDRNIDSVMFDEVAGILEFDNILPMKTAERLAFRGLSK